VKSIYKFLLLAGFCITGVAATAQTPELSADEPISYSADRNLLIATGNAVYQDENTRVEADEIRYNRETNKIDASGNVRVTRKGLRLLADALSYDAAARTFSAGRFRAGYPPFFIEGESFSGDLDRVDFSKVSLYFREPVAHSPKVDIETGTWRNEESISGEGLRLRAFRGFSLPLPGFDYAFGSATAEVRAQVGYRNRLGAYAQSQWLYPFSRSLSLGGNLDLYSKRGVLIGPALEWTRPDGRIQLTLDSGWIHDHDFDERGSDILGNRIEQDRGFVGFGLRMRDDGELQFQSRGRWLSDSEVLRDFRDDDYFRAYQPDHFMDFTWQKEHFLLNAFARRQINDSYGMVERLPEIRAEWLPSELGKTGFHVQASAGAVRYRLREVAPYSFSVDFPDNPLGLPGRMVPAGDDPADLVKRPYHNRLDGSLTLTRPLHGPAGIDLVLRAGGRWSEYRRDATGESPSLSEDRWVGELGFDLSRTLARTWSLDRPKWNIERMRHVSRLEVAYRWHPGAEESADQIPPLDVYAYHASPPVLDLADLLHVDALREWNIARFGWKNRVMVAGEGQAFRDFLGLNFYQDLLFSADEGEPEWEASYIEADFHPFPWLDLRWRQKFDTEELDTEASFLSATLHSADLWAVRLQAEYLKGAIEEYELAGTYRLTEDLSLLGSVRYNSRLDAWTRQEYGFSRRFSNVWHLQMYVALTDLDDRGDDFSVGMRLVWISF
jgi:LPS-assembly protein